MTCHLLLTFDVEDWFQVENLKGCIPFSSWEWRESRVERNTYRLLDLLDSTKQRQSDRYGESDLERPHATFFVLGWIAERYPGLVREIQARGHEVASHGYHHNLCSGSSYEELSRELTDSRKVLEDITGGKVYGYRAPSFFVDKTILKIIEDCGYLYDSSYNSFSMHGRYGELDLSANGRNGIATNISKGFYELPISNLRIGNRVVPWGGGGYFRLLPYMIFRAGVEAILRKQKTYLFYMHPWEIDPGQPRVNMVRGLNKFRHYVNLHKTASKLSLLIDEFREYPFLSCYQYLESLPGMQM